MKITIDIDDEHPLAARFQQEVRCAQSNQRAAQVRHDDLAASVRAEHALVRPTVQTPEEVAADLLAAGVSVGLPPTNTAIAIRPKSETRARRGETVEFGPVHLPIGLQVVKMTALAADGPHWNVLNLFFGNYSVTNSQGDRGVPLRELLCMTSRDLLSVFDNARTKVDVQVSGQLCCMTDGAVFQGFTLHGEMEEARWAIEARVTRTVVREDDFVRAMKTRYRRADASDAWVVAYATSTHLLLRPENDPEYYTVCERVLGDGWVVREVVSRDGVVVAAGRARDVPCVALPGYPNALAFGTASGTERVRLATSTPERWASALFVPIGERADMPTATGDREACMRERLE